MMYNQFKSTSHLINDNNKIRNEQIDELYDAINDYKSSNNTDKNTNYDKLMNFLDSLMQDTKKGSFSGNEFNLLNSGLHQLCSDLKGELEAKHSQSLTNPSRIQPKRNN